MSNDKLRRDYRRNYGRFSTFPSLGAFHSEVFFCPLTAAQTGDSLFESALMKYSRQISSSDSVALVRQLVLSGCDRLKIEGNNGQTCSFASSEARWRYVRVKLNSRWFSLRPV